jgi:hypothetical protein
LADGAVAPRGASGVAGHRPAPPTTTWWRRNAAGSDKVAALAITQPLSVTDGALLPSRIDAQAVLGSYGALQTWIDVDLARGFDVEEIGGDATGNLGPMTVSAAYARWTARAERFRRAQYQLAAEGGELGDTAYLHVVRGSVGIRGGERVYASYSAAYLLPVPVPENGEPRPAGFTNHAVAAVYRSPCDCWEAGVTVSVPTRDPWENLRAQVNLAIGGYSLGN